MGVSLFHFASVIITIIVFAFSIVTVLNLIVIVRLYSNLNVFFFNIISIVFRTIVMLILVKILTTAIARLLLAKPPCFCVVILIVSVTCI